MKIKIEIITKGEEKINADVIDTINNTMRGLGYKNISFKEYDICDGCEIKLPMNYPKEPDKDRVVLCPNCETGKQDAIKGSI